VEPAIAVEGLTKHYEDIRGSTRHELHRRDGRNVRVPRAERRGEVDDDLDALYLARPTSGHARVARSRRRHRTAAVRSRIKLDFQHPTVDVYLTAEHNLLFHGELYEVPKPALGRSILQVLEMVELVELWELSRGGRRPFSPPDAPSSRDRAGSAPLIAAVAEFSRTD